jgi:hypothetical protein
MSFLTQRLDLEKLGLRKLGLENLNLERLEWPPPPNPRHLLAYIHSGDVLRQFLPKFLRFVAFMGLLVLGLRWLLAWPGIYEGFERWGLVKAFFAQVIALASAFLGFKITMLRAGHLEVLPADDFLTLRATSIMCRWVGESQLVFWVGTVLSSLLQPVGAVLNMGLSGIAPKAAVDVSSGTPALLFLSGPLSFIILSVSGLLFLFFYAIATGIDVTLAIEFNTRSENAKGRLA